jgi:hypothetical protein
LSQLFKRDHLFLARRVPGQCYVSSLHSGQDSFFTPRRTCHQE